MVCTMALNPPLGWAQEEQPLAAMMSRVAQGDEDFLAELYDRTSRMVYGLALRILGDPNSAEDITLEVYMQVWRTAESYDAGRGTVEAWLVTLVRSRAIDWLRSRPARSQQVEHPLENLSVLQDTRPNPELASIESARARVVEGALAALPADQRQIIELAFFAGMSHNEIARQTDLPLGTVKTRIRLGMLRMRELLGGQQAKL